MKKLFKKYLALSLATLMTASNFVSPTMATEEDLDLNLPSYHYQENLEKKFDPALGSLQEDEKVRVIVELKEEPIIIQATEQGLSLSDLNTEDFSEQQEKINKEQKEVKELIKKENIDLVSDTENDFDFSVTINGFSGELAAKDLNKLAELDNVKAVYRAREYMRPSMKTSTDLIADYKRLEESIGLNFKGQGSVIGIIDTGLDPDHKDLQKIDSSKIKLKKEDVEKLIKEHSLRGRYISEKVPYGYDYQDNEENTKENAKSQHGMHVSGTVSANGDTENGGIKGVAPETQLLALKVFSDDPNMNSVFSDRYLAAVEDAIVLGADAVNLSLGAPAGLYDRSGEAAEDLAFKRAEENGVVVLIAGGNERNIGNGYRTGHSDYPDQGLVGSPSTFMAPLSVASYENTKTHSGSIKGNIEGKDQAFMANFHEASPKEALTKKVVYAKKGIVEGTHNDYDGIDAEGKIVIVERGGNTLMTMFINPPYSIPMAFLGHDDGMKIVKEFEKSSETEVTLDSSYLQFVNPNANKISSFSSWGPSSDLRMKPEVTAPGGNIFSTQNDHSYSVMSGTSMATPHVAGATAVLRQALREGSGSLGYKELDGFEAAKLSKILFMNTAIPQKENESPHKEYYSVMEQGAGMISVNGAVTTPVYVTATGTNDETEDGKLEFKDIKDKKFDIKLTFNNRSNQEQTYKLSELVMLKEEIGQDGFFTDNSKKINSTKTGPDSIKIDANSSAELNLSISFDGIEDNQLVSGFLRFESEKQPTLTIPVLGFNGDWNSPRAIDAFKDLDNNKSYLEASYFTDANLKTYGLDKEGKPIYTRGFNLPIIEKKGEKVVFFSEKTNIMPIFSPVRNCEHLVASISDSNGKEIARLFDFLGQRKISKIYQNKSPFVWHTSSLWNGRDRNGLVKEGEKYYYNFSAQINYKTDKPQEFKYAVALDNTAPSMTDIKLDKAKRKLEVKVNDALTGTHYVWVQELGAKDHYIQLQNVYKTDNTNQVRKDYKDFKDGDTLTFDIPNDWNLDNCVVNAEDGVWNLRTLDLNGNEPKPSQPAPQPQDPAQPLYPEDAVPTITFKKPDLLSFHQGPTVRIQGIVSGVNELNSLTLEQIKTGTKEILSSPVKALIFPNPDKTFTFIANMDVEGEELTEIRATAKTNKQEATVTHEFWIDRTNPTLEISSESCSVDKKTIDLKFHVTDNYPAITVDEYVNGRYFQQINRFEVSDLIQRLPIDKEFTKTFDLKDGINEFFFEADDAAGNWIVKKVIVNSANCKVEVQELQQKDQPNVPEPNVPEAKVPEAKVPEAKVQEVFGKDRYETAVKISNENHKRSETVVLASGQEFADALVSTVLASSLDAPLLLTEKDNLTQVTSNEIARLQAKTVYIIGGTNAISQEAENKLNEKSIKTIRIFGENRYETSVKVAEEILKVGGNIKDGARVNNLIFANGINFADTSSVTPFAGKNGTPILLVDSKLSESQKNLINYLKLENAYIIGGERAVNKSLENEVAQLAKETKRVFGEDRYQTSLKIWETFMQDSKVAVMATGKDFPDSLTGSLLAIKNNGPMILVDPKGLTKECKESLEKSQINKIIVIGGEAAINAEIRDNLKALNLD